MGMALCVLASPMPASAAESSVLMASGGVASVLEMERSLEEYIQIAQDAQGASWGYTNIGVANVESGNLNIRAVPSTDGKLVGKLPKDAYVSQEFVTVEEKLDTAITMTELLYGQGVSDVRVDLVEYAKQFVGNPYVWGGTSLTKGADCSGFVLAVFKKYGIALSHSSRAQANEGTKISASDLKPGDLIFYGNGKGNINHVAIYIGGGQVIHASSPKTGIKISSYKYRTPVKCVRVIQD